VKVKVDMVSFPCLFTLERLSLFLQDSTGGKDRTKVEQEIWIRYSTPRRVVIRMVSGSTVEQNR
jgi:hypothetical protein